MSVEAFSKPDRGEQSYIRQVAICALILIMVLASRISAIRCPVELNVDESQMMVQAARYSQDLVPWRSVDGTTGGPVNSWFLLLASRLGVPLNYRGVHLLAALLMGGIVSIGYLTVRILCPPKEAALVGLVGVLTVCFIPSADFAHFSSELLSALLLSIAALLCVRSIKRDGSPLPGWLAAGVLIGITPWAKLQAVPVGFLLGLFTLWQIRRCRPAAPLSGQCPEQKRKSKVLAISCTAGALIFPSVAILVLVVAAGAFPDFWNSYVLGNLNYAGHLTLAAWVRNCLWVFSDSEIGGLMVAAVAAFFLLIAKGHPMRAITGGAVEDRFLRFAVLFFIFSVIACTRPAHWFSHYQVFLISPLLLVIGALIRLVNRQVASGDAGTAASRFVWIAIVVCLLGCVTGYSFGRLRQWKFYQKQLAQTTRSASTSTERQLAASVRSAAPQARSMAVWGWMPSLYVQTGLACATRHAICHFLIDPWPGRKRMRKTFMLDLASAKPDIVVDAMADGCFMWTWDSSAGMESFPELAEYVRQNYVLTAQPVLTPGGTPVRIFVKRPSAK